MGRAELADQAESDKGTRGAARLLPLLLVLLVAACYAQVTAAEVVNWDDPAYVGSDTVHDPLARRQTVRMKAGLTPANVAWAFRDVDTAGMYIPATWLSLLLDVTVFGHKAAGFHFTNLVLHACNAALVYTLLRRTTGAPWRAALVAALWALHPLRVESVAWITERKDVLSTFLGLLALLAYVRACRTGRIRDHALVTVLFAGALLAKPMLVTLPALLLVMDFWPLRRAMTWLRLTEKLPLLVLSAACVAVTFVAQGRSGSTYSLGARSFAVRAGTALCGYGAYLWHTVWPGGLAPFHALHDTWPAWQLGACAAALAVISGLGVWALRRGNRAVLAGWLWFLVALLPVCGLFQAGRQAWADRFSYLPAVGLTVAAVWALPATLGRRARLVVAAGTVAAVAALGAMTTQQVAYWHDGEALWSRATDVEGDTYLFRVFRANYLYEKAEFERAAEQFKAAAAMSPESAEAQHGWGICLAELGAFEPACARLALAEKLAKTESERTLYRRSLVAVRALMERRNQAVPGVGKQGER